MVSSPWISQPGSPQQPPGHWGLIHLETGTHSTTNSMISEVFSNLNHSMSCDPQEDASGALTILAQEWEPVPQTGLQVSLIFFCNSVL